MIFDILEIIVIYIYKNPIKNIIKNNNLKISNTNTNNASNITSNHQYNEQQQLQLDIARENRLSQIITLYSKGLTLRNCTKDES